MSTKLYWKWTPKCMFCFCKANGMTHLHWKLNSVKQLTISLYTSHITTRRHCLIILAVKQDLCRSMMENMFVISQLNLKNWIEDLKPIPRCLHHGGYTHLICHCAIFLHVITWYTHYSLHNPWIPLPSFQQKCFCATQMHCLHLNVPLSHGF